MNKKAQFGLGLGPKKRKRKLSAADKKRIAAKQGWRCARCKKPLPARFHVDHIKPFSAGGSDRASNLQALCSNCHSEKTEEERYRKKQKKIRETERRERDPFGSMFKAPRGRKPKSPFGKIDIGLGPAPKKKGRKKKDPFDLF